MMYHLLFIKLGKIFYQWMHLLYYTYMRDRCYDIIICICMHVDVQVHTLYKVIYPWRLNETQLLLPCEQASQFLCTIYILLRRGAISKHTVTCRAA